MHILVLTDEIYPDGVSGIGKSVFNECVALARRGNQVNVLVRSVNSSLPSETVIDGVKLFRFNGLSRQHIFYHFYPLIVLFAVSRWLYRYSQPFEIIYTFNPLYILPVWWTRVYRRAAVIHVFYSSMAEEIRINAQHGKYGRLGILGSVVAGIIAIIEKWAFSKADVILPRSQYTMQVLKIFYPNAPINTVLPTGVDIEKYHPIPSLDARAQLGFNKDQSIFITVRRLEGRMGLHNLIEAIHLLQEKYSNILLLIVGKGHLRASLETLVQDYGLTNNVRFLGFVSETELPIYLAAADLFVLPTEMLEGFGLATVEAMSSGIPVMGTPIGATPEILGPVTPNLITDDISSVALAKTMSYWLDHKKELAELGLRSRVEVEKHYDADIVAKELEELFQSVSRKLNAHS